MANIINNYSSSVVTIFQNVIKDYERDLDVIKDIEDQLNDLSHEIELSKPKDMYSGYKLYRQIRELRIEQGGAKKAEVQA